MSEKIIYQNKSMLNLPGNHGIAAISISMILDENYHSFSEEEENDKEHKPSINGEISISDCNRAVHLDLYANDKKSFENNLHKLSTLANMLQEAHFNLKSQQQEFNDRWDRVDARQKQQRLKNSKKVEGDKAD